MFLTYILQIDIGVKIIKTDSKVDVFQFEDHFVQIFIILTILHNSYFGCKFDDRQIPCISFLKLEEKKLNFTRKITSSTQVHRILTR